MNIAEILKDCPKDTRLYCSVYGEVELYEINLNEILPIKVHAYDNSVRKFTKDGKLCATYNDSECVLFPSKENRDWSTFKVPEKEYNFKPFDKVLVRDDDFCNWDIDLFSYINNSDKYKYKCLYADWNQCIPYEGNEHLLGINNPA